MLLSCWSSTSSESARLLGMVLRYSMGGLRIIRSNRILHQFTETLLSSFNPLPWIHRSIPVSLLSPPIHYPLARLSLSLCLSLFEYNYWLLEDGRPATQLVEARGWGGEEKAKSFRLRDREWKGKRMRGNTMSEWETAGEGGIRQKGRIEEVEVREGWLASGGKRTPWRWRVALVVPPHVGSRGVERGLEERATGQRFTKEVEEGGGWLSYTPRHIQLLLYIYTPYNTRINVRLVCISVSSIYVYIHRKAKPFRYHCLARSFCTDN